MERLDLFGSAARRTDFDPETSDADFQRLLPKDMLRCFMGLKLDQAEDLGREVDIGSMGAIRNKWRQAHIDRSRETVCDIAA